MTYVIGFIVYFPDTQFNVEAYGPFGITLSLIMMLAVFLTSVGTRKRIPYLPASRVNNDKLSALSVLKKTFSEIRSALTNRSFRWMFAGVLIVFAMVGVDNALNLHMNTYFWNCRARQPILFCRYAGGCYGHNLCRYLHRLFDKKPSVIIGTSCWALCQWCPWCCGSWTGFRKWDRRTAGDINYHQVCSGLWCGAGAGFL